MFPMTGKKIGPRGAVLIAVRCSGILLQVTAASAGDVEIGQLPGYGERSGCAVCRNNIAISSIRD
jgi:hypothetical protein